MQGKARLVLDGELDLGGDFSAARKTFQNQNTKHKVEEIIPRN